MEKFKAVEKAMKTKAYSKEGLSAAAKLDPKEQAKIEASEFLSNMVDELEQQIETLEAESESLQATMKKGKGHAAKAERVAEIERIIDRHKWHQGKLELIRRSLENGGVDAEQVNDLEESIKYYVSDGMNGDFMEDEGMYDDLSLQDEEDAYGMNQDNDKTSSQDNQSIQSSKEKKEEEQEAEQPEKPSKPAPALSGKQRAAVEAATNAGRRPSNQLKSPLPTLATVHATSSSNLSNGTSGPQMKPAAVPSRLAGEGLKYASAAAAAAANEKNNVGIAPLPPPPANAPGGPGPQGRISTTNSPRVPSSQPAGQDKASTAGSSSTVTPAKAGARSKAAAQPPAQAEAESSKGLRLSNHIFISSHAYKPIADMNINFSDSADEWCKQRQAEPRSRRGGTNISLATVSTGLSRFLRNLEEESRRSELAINTTNAGCVECEQAVRPGWRTAAKLSAGG